MSIKNTHIEGDISYQRNITAGGSLNIQGSARFGHGVIVEGWLEAKNIKCANKGLFNSYNTLFNTYPRPENGWFAGVNATAEEIESSGLSVEEGYSLFVMYIANSEKWEKIAGKFYKIEVDVDAISKLEEGFRQLSIEHEEYDNLLKKQDIAIQDHDNRISTLEPKVELNTSKIDELKEGFTCHLEDYDNLKSLVSEDNSRISNNESDISSLKSKDVTHDNQINSIKTDLYVTNTNVNNNASEITSLKSNVGQITLDVSELKTEVSNHESEISSIKARASEHENQINNIWSAHNVTETKAQKLSADLVELSAVVDGKANQSDMSDALEHKVELEDFADLDNRLTASISKKADLNNTSQTISAGIVDVFDKIIFDKGEEAYIQYDNGIEDNCNSFIAISDTQQGTGAIIKIPFTGSEEKVAYESTISEKLTPINNSVSSISLRADMLEQDMDHALGGVDSLSVRCDSILNSVSIVLQSMGTTIDNEGNVIDDGGAEIAYSPSVGDRYFKESIGHIIYQKSEIEETDLGVPRGDRIYCNMMTKRLYVYNNGWKKVGESNDDLTKIKSDIQLNSSSIEAISEVLSSKKDEIQYVEMLTDVLYGTAKNKFIVLSQGLSLSLNKSTLGFNEGEFNEVYFLLDDSNELYISGWDIYSSEDVIIESGYQYLIHIVNHYMTFTKLNTSITNADGGVAVQ